MPNVRFILGVAIVVGLSLISYADDLVPGSPKPLNVQTLDDDKCFDFGEVLVYRKVSGGETMLSTFLKPVADLRTCTDFPSEAGYQIASYMGLPFAVWEKYLITQDEYKFEIRDLSKNSVLDEVYVSSSVEMKGDSIVYWLVQTDAPFAGECPAEEAAFADGSGKVVIQKMESRNLRTGKITRSSDRRCGGDLPDNY